MGKNKANLLWICLLSAIFNLTGTIVVAQIDTGSQWTWVKGDAAISSSPVYGLKGISAKKNTPGGRFGSCSWKDKAGDLWIFGGNGWMEGNGDSRVRFNDLWKYSQTTNEWIWVSGDSSGNVKATYGIKGIPSDNNNPGSRMGSYSWTDTSGDFWLYGGENYLNDLWKFDPSLNQWTWMNGDTVAVPPVYGIKGVPAVTNKPGFRFNCTSSADKAGNLWLYGGSNGYFNDLWKFETSINQWTWISGDIVAVPPVYGIKGVPGQNNKPGGRENGAAWIDNAGNFWLFGGYKDMGKRWPSGYLNDLWKFDISTNQWTWINGDTTIDASDVYGTKGVPSVINKPGGNKNCITWIDLSGNLWLLGRGILWKYDPAANLWTWLNAGMAVYGSQGIANARNEPGPRTKGNSWVDQTGNLWMFAGTMTSDNAGGYQKTELLNDLWKFDPPSAQWTWMKGGSHAKSGGAIFGIKGIGSPENGPGQKAGANLWTDESGNFWLFGGNNDNDLWKYDLKKNQWTWMKGEGISYAKGVYGTKGVETVDNNPCGRYDFASWKDKEGNFWLFGGFQNPYNLDLNDLWKYKPATNQWVWVNGDSIVNISGIYGTKEVEDENNKPGARHNPVSWTDKDGNLWLFGGYGRINGLSRFLNDLWKYNPATNKWTWMKGDNFEHGLGVYGTKGVAHPANKPAPRYRSMSWTDKIGNLWLFGGQVEIKNGGGTSYIDINDLWKYDVKTNEWTWMKGDSATQFKLGMNIPSKGFYGEKGIGSENNTPGGKEGSATWVDQAGNLWLFGGGQKSDLWRYNPSLNEWTWIKGDSTFDFDGQGDYGTQDVMSPNNTPGDRSYSISWIDQRGRFWLYGGRGLVSGSSLTHTDLWMLSNKVAYYTTVASGNWNDPSIWAGNVVPPEAADIIIRTNVVGNTSTICSTLRVEAPGSLTVNPGIKITVLY